MVEDIIRFASLVEQINELSEFLEDNRKHFYDGGKPFEKIYSSDIDDLEKMCSELKELIIKIK